MMKYDNLQSLTFSPSYIMIMTYAEHVKRGCTPDPLTVSITGTTNLASLHQRRHLESVMEMTNPT